MGMSTRVIFRGANSTEALTSPERNSTSPYHLLLCICKENPYNIPPASCYLASANLYPDFRSLPKGVLNDKGDLSEKFDQVCVCSYL